MLSSQERMNGIGGSECASAVGLHPKVTREQLMTEKLVLTEKPQSWVMWWGKGVEDFVLQTLEERPRFVTPMPPPISRIRGEFPTLWHKRHPWAFATPDGMVEVGKNADVMLEIKTSPVKKAEGWGAAGTDLIPAHYACQVLWNMEVLRSTGRDIKEAWVLALFGTREPQRFIIPFDQGRADWLFEQAEIFWTEVLDARAKQTEAA